MTTGTDYTTTHGILPVAAFDDNYIWLIRQGQQAVVVDPGEAEPVQAVLQAQGLTLNAILITHHHGDHIGGVEALRADWPEAVIYAPHDERIALADVRVGAGDVVSLPAVGATFTVLAAPGHTRTHIVYAGEVANVGPVLLAGDVLFSAGCGRLFEGTPAEMADTLAQFDALSPQTRVYCGHEYTASNLRWARAVEPDNSATAQWQDEVAALRAAQRPSVPTTLELERAVNPFLRLVEPAVVAAACRYAGHAVASRADVLGALRTWKNEFR